MFAVEFSPLYDFIDLSVADGCCYHFLGAKIWEWDFGAYANNK